MRGYDVMGPAKLWLVTAKDGRVVPGFGADPKMAAVRAVALGLKISHTRQGAEGGVKVCEARAVRVGDEVRLMAAHEELPFAGVPVDPLFYFMELEVATQLHLVRAVNYLQAKEGNVLFSMYRRMGNFIVGGPARAKPFHFEIAMYLRLLMVIDLSRMDRFNERSVVTLRGMRRVEVYGDRHIGARAQAFVDTHGDNLGPELLEEMIRHPGVDCNLLDSRAVDTICRMAASYGYNPKEMDYAELMALWHGGPRALKRYRARRSMGLKDLIGHYEKLKQG